MGDTGATQLIIDTSEIGDADHERGPDSAMDATVQSDPDAKIEFHVQMRAWTQRDMEELVIEAAARQIVGAHDRDSQVVKAIEAAAIQAITAKADAKLATVSAEIIDQPIMPTFGAKEPVTLRDFIGLYAKDYLTQVVDRDGKPSSSGYATTGRARIVWIIERALDHRFKLEIEKATNAAILEIQTAIREQHKALLTAETARIRAAIAKATA